MMKTILAATALLVTMTACNGGKKEALDGPTWKLVSMQGIPAEAIDAESDAFVLEFNAADTMVFGRTNCNRFFGRYELQKNTLGFNHMGMTRMACPEMEYEDLFVKMLDEVNSYKIKGSELTLLGDSRVLAVFKAQPKPAQE